MNEPVLILLGVLIGALTGTARTYLMHGLKFVKPNITIRDRTFKIKFGWIVATTIGAFMAWMVVSGLYLFDYEITSTIDVVMASAIVGWSSLDIINRWVAGKLTDVEDKVFDLSIIEPNEHKFALIQEIMSAVKCVERVVIRDDFRAGLAMIYVVPKKGYDPEETRQNVEKFVYKKRQIGVVMHVELPEEIVIDVGLTAFILDVSDREPDSYKEAIECIIRSYIDSLPPGKWIQKHQIINRSMNADRFVQDTRDLTTNPPIEDGLHIKIKQFQVARAGTIKVDVKVVPSNSNGY